ncbi:MAG: hypothetical protein CMJ47_09905 [Planctomyces sp.]|nr:hypothetical protein [Planctomyces sp.]
MDRHRECYGGMFPDVLDLPSDQPVSGKVFTVLLDRAGGMMRSERHIEADQSEWDACRRCPEFNDCYQFSMAQLTLASAVATQ